MGQILRMLKIDRLKHNWLENPSVVQNLFLKAISEHKKLV